MKMNVIDKFPKVKCPKCKKWVRTMSKCPDCNYEIFKIRTNVVFHPERYKK